jgi:hypothetical protein
METRQRTIGRSSSFFERDAIAAVEQLGLDLCSVLAHLGHCLMQMRERCLAFAAARSASWRMDGMTVIMVVWCSADAGDAHRGLP